MHARQTPRALRSDPEQLRLGALHRGGTPLLPLRFPLGPRGFLHSLRARQPVPAHRRGGGRFH
eukprot:8577627-Lingulodinium_polyedra.AAC.1